MSWTLADAATGGAGFYLEGGAPFYYATCGCTDETACNYDVFANEDDDSCVYAEDLDPWCDDVDGDQLGAGDSVYSCTQPYVDQFIFSWVQDCSDPEPDCATNEIKELLLERSRSVIPL